MDKQVVENFERVLLGPVNERTNAHKNSLVCTLDDRLDLRTNLMIEHGMDSGYIIYWPKKTDENPNIDCQLANMLVNFARKKVKITIEEVE